MQRRGATFLCALFNLAMLGSPSAQAGPARIGATVVMAKVSRACTEAGYGLGLTESMAAVDIHELKTKRPPIFGPIRVRPCLFRMLG